MRYVLAGLPPAVAFYGGLAIGVTFVATIILAFTLRRPQFTWRRILGLCALALVLGPFAGAGQAALLIPLSNASPLDRWPLLGDFAIVGTIAGLVVAILTALIGGAVRALRSGWLKGPLRLRLYTWTACLVVATSIAWVHYMGKDSSVLRWPDHRSFCYDSLGWPLESWVRCRAVEFMPSLPRPGTGQPLSRCVVVHPAATAVNAVVCLAMLVAVAATCERLTRKRTPRRFDGQDLLMVAIIAATALALAKCEVSIPHLIALSSQPWIISGSIRVAFGCLTYQAIVLAVRLFTYQHKA